MWSSESSVVGLPSQFFWTLRMKEPALRGTKLRASVWKANHGPLTSGRNKLARTWCFIPLNVLLDVWITPLRCWYCSNCDPFDISFTLICGLNMTGKEGCRSSLPSLQVSIGNPKKPAVPKVSKEPDSSSLRRKGSERTSIQKTNCAIADSVFCWSSPSETSPHWNREVLKT